MLLLPAVVRLSIDAAQLVVELLAVPRRRALHSGQNIAIFLAFSRQRARSDGEFAV